MYALDLLCFDEPFRFDLRSMRWYASQPDAIVEVVEQDTSLRGFIVVNLTHRREPRTAYITTLDVHPDSRRRGIAGLLVSEAELRSRVAGATAMRLHVFTGNLPAIRFYEASGYRQVRLNKGLYGAGLDAWNYSKSL